MTATTHKRVLAVVTDDLSCSESVEEIRREAGDGGTELRVVVPAVEASAFRHTMGDVDEPKKQAEERLQMVLDHLRENGVSASGEVGDPDPVEAAEDALREAPADEVLIFGHAGSDSRWFEDGLFDRARERLEPPLRMVVIEHDDDGGEHVADVETASAGRDPRETRHEIGSAYLPGLSRADLAGIVAGIAGTVAVAVLAAVVTSGGNQGWEAAAILIAIGTALINLAHVVGLTLFESVRYRGGFAKLFHRLSLIITPVAVLANLLIVLFA